MKSAITAKHRCMQSTCSTTGKSPEEVDGIRSAGPQPKKRTPEVQQGRIERRPFDSSQRQAKARDFQMAKEIQESSKAPRTFGFILPSVSLELPPPGSQVSFRGRREGDGMRGSGGGREGMDRVGGRMRIAGHHLDG